MTKILYFEDDQEISIFVKTLLESSGYVVEHYYSGKDIIKKVSQTKPDLILLDLTLPDADGIDVCRELKSDVRYKAIPIIILTARVSTEDKIVGFECGADDYMTKPFNPWELVARVNAVIRRSVKIELQEKVLLDKELKIDLETHSVEAENKQVNLTPKEFDLLCYLIKNRGKLLSRENLLNYVWGMGYFGTTRTVDVHIARLREKLPKKYSEKIVTQERLGYKYV